MKSTSINIIDTDVDIDDKFLLETSVSRSCFGHSCSMTHCYGSVKHFNKTLLIEIEMTT